jgi:pimeloyl-ACP methyl ester carboxylesterase
VAAKTAIVRDIPIHYEEIGEGRPIVLLHGWARTKPASSRREPTYASCRSLEVESGLEDDEYV